ncbi:uncharacterized protein LOC132048911 [Lycium ferocissimum]|uniref:uncharacterized protein LOC132048911 n=1 Tax=Lycium ferocissimum TaxID=112874 RepID=UPI00281533FC|nr:uncharacterized protein LOC132048911 [Lycium ferocissimum]
MVIALDPIIEEEEAHTNMPIVDDEVHGEEKVIDIPELKQLTVNFSFLDAVKEMPECAKFVKDLLRKKRFVQHEMVNLTHRVSSVIASTTVQKKRDPGAFTIPCNIGLHAFAHALCDNGMANRSIKKSVGLIDDVLVQVDIPIILGRPFLATGRALMDSEKNEIKFPVNDEEVNFQASKGMKLLSAYERISVIDSFDGIDDAVEHKMEEESLGKVFAAVLVNFDADDMKGYVEIINALERLGSYTYHPRKLGLDLANRTTPSAKSSIVEPPKLEIKQLPLHLRYEFLGPNKILPVIVSALLTEEQIEQLVEILREYRRAIGWTIADIRGISSGICEHKIQLEEDSKPSVEHQRRLNQNMQEVVKKEIIKWLDAGVVYPIADSKWACWEILLLFPRWVLRYNQINIALKDQEKTTFTCPYGTFAFNRMPFGLCNTPATFQRCMMSIFSNMVEDFLKVFMDDFSVMGDSFDDCLDHLGQLLEKEAKFVFDDKCQVAFNLLKERLTSAPVIVTPNWSLAFELMCDASDFAIGAVLSQRHNKIMHPIYYASRTLNAAQMNYTVTEQDLLAIVYAFEKFRSYLLGPRLWCTPIMLR